MWISCPHGKCKLQVNVYDGVCDATDLCGFEPCEFYDDSRKATRRFQKAAAHYHSLEGFIETQTQPELHLQRRPPQAYTSRRDGSTTH